MSGKYHGYPEYKDASVQWMGSIPSHWIETSLKRYCRVTDGSHHSPKIQSDGMPFVSVTDVGVNNINFEDSKKITHEDYLRLVQEGCRPKVGDVLLTKDGTIGRAAIVAEDFPEFVILSSLGLLTPKEELSNVFLYYYLISGVNVDQMNSLIHGSALRRMTISKIDSLLITIPPVDEQQKIANFLDHETAKIDTLIEKQQQLIALLKEKRQAVISHAVTKGLNPDAPMKNSGVEWLGEVPEHWDVSRVKYHCLVKGRIGFRGYTVEDLVDKEDGALVLGASEMNTVGEVVLDNPQYISWEKYFESPEIMLEEGMILIVQRGSTVGKVASIPAGLGKATINPSLIVLRDLSVSSKFMSYSLMGSLVKSFVEMARSSTAIPMISQEQVGNYWQLVPPKQEQIEIETYIVEKLKGIDCAIDLSERSIGLMQERRTALISAAVTGKIDVRNWQAPTTINEPSKDAV